LIADIINLIDNYSLLTLSSIFGICYEIVFLLYATLPIAIVTHYVRKISPRLHFAYGELLIHCGPNAPLTKRIQQTLDFIAKNKENEAIELIGITISPSLLIKVLHSFISIILILLKLKEEPE
jgi:hypothetical protein